ncbi:hypothetical protein AHAS_Ahas18G0083100 [Arachis hypogaea]
MEDHRHRRHPLLPLPSSAPGASMKLLDFSISRFHPNSCDYVLPETLSLKAMPPSVPATEGDDLVTPQSIGEDAVDGEKSSAAAALAAAAAAAGRMKKSSVKSKSGPKTAWRKLLSQCSQHILAFQMINLLQAIMKTPHCMCWNGYYQELDFQTRL